MREQEVQSFLEKVAIECIPPSERNVGFYSRYFIVSKNDGGLCAIIDLHHLNHSLKRFNSLSTLVLPHTSSSTGAGCHGTNGAEASSVRISLNRSAPGSSRGVHQDEVRRLLVAPFCPARVWFLDLIALLDGLPWELPVRRDRLSQPRGTIHHPR